MKVQYKKEPKSIIESNDVQLKDKVEVQSGQYVDFIILQGFHTPKKYCVSYFYFFQKFMFLLFSALTRMTKQKGC